jgi:hypothetical protein
MLVGLRGGDAINETMMLGMRRAESLLPHLCFLCPPFIPIGSRERYALQRGHVEQLHVPKLFPQTLDAILAHERPQSKAPISIACIDNAELTSWSLNRGAISVSNRGALTAILSVPYPLVTSTNQTRRKRKSRASRSGYIPHFSSPMGYSRLTRNDLWVVRYS